MRLEIVLLLSNILRKVRIEIMKSLLFSCFFLFLIPLAFSQPILFNPIPQNNSYVPGGPRNFTINITSENLNVSSVFLHIKAKDEVSWATYQMECNNYTLQDWFCITPVPFEIVGSDTVELYYFEASDLDGNVGYNGTADSPLKLTVDKNPPTISWYRYQGKA